MAAVATALGFMGSGWGPRPRAPVLQERSLDAQRHKMEAAQAKRLRRRVRNLATAPIPNVDHD